MDRVVVWERMRVVKTLTMFAVAVAVLVIIGSVVIGEIRDRQILAELSILREDWEVIWQFGGEIIRTVWEELPRIKLGVVLVAGMVGWSLWRRWPVVRKKIAYLTKYKEKE